MKHRRFPVLILLPTLLMGSLVPARAAQKASGHNAVVAGQTLDARGAPLPFVPIRIRNLDNGMVVSHSTSTHLAEFSFLVPAEATYIVEAFERQTGQVLAVGPAVSVKAGEAVGIIVQLPAKRQTFAGFFGNTAAAILSAAAAAGITAVTTGNPVTPEQ
jgi:hypothetical protein